MNKFEVLVDHPLKLVKITAKGELFQEDGEQVITVARTKAAEHGYSVLYNIREATTIVPFSSWFFMPRNLPVLQNPQTKYIKAAILVSPQDKALKDYEFYKLTTSNLGLKIQIFFDMTAALEWLQE